MIPPQARNFSRLETKENDQWKEISGSEFSKRSITQKWLDQINEERKSVQDLDKKVIKVDEVVHNSEEKLNTTEGKLQLPSEEQCLQASVMWLAKLNDFSWGRTPVHHRLSFTATTYTHFPQCLDSNIDWQESLPYVWRKHVFVINGSAMENNSVFCRKLKSEVRNKG